MAISEADSSDSDEISKPIIQIVKLQESSGVIRATIPMDAVNELGLEKGDRIAFKGEEGDRTLSVGKASEFL